MIAPSPHPYPAYKPSGVPWFGDVPNHWEVLRLGDIMRERIQLNRAGNITDVLSVVRDRGVIPYDEKGNIGNKKSDDITRYKIVRPGDIVINSMNVIIGSVGLSRYTGCLSPVYHVLTNRSSDDLPEFLNLVFQVKSFQHSLVRIGNGILDHRLRIPVGLLKQETLARPPLSEQQAIVRYLDHVDGRIRRLVDAKRRLISLLEEERQAVINQAVTRGLDPNVDLKPSGVDWLGDIPAHWEVRRLKSIARIRYGLGQPPAEMADGKPLIRATNVARGRILTKDLIFVDPEDVPAGRNAFLSEKEIVVVRSGAYTADSAIVPSQYLSKCCDRL